MKSVLFILEKSPWLGLLTDALTGSFVMTCVPTVLTAQRLLLDKHFDLILADGSIVGALALPRLARPSRRSTLFIFLSSGHHVDELVQAFQSDYDDYLSLPTEAIELKLRLLARFKEQPVVQAHEILWRGSLRLVIPQQRVVQASADGERDLELTPNEFRILYALVTRERQILSRDEILREAWGEGLHVEARTVDKHVCSLRRKLGSYAKALISVAGKGYLFDTQLAQGTVVNRPIAISADV